MDQFTENDFSAMLNEMNAEVEGADKKAFSELYYKAPASDGIFQIRVLPPLKQFDEKLFYAHHRLHYISKKPYFCLGQTLVDANGVLHESEDCPVCRKAKQLYNIADGNRECEEAKIASSISAKERYVTRVIVRGAKDADGNDVEYKPKFWEFGKKLFSNFYETIKLGECGNFLSLKDGRDFNLNKKGTGRNTDYSGSALSMKTSPVFSDVEKIKKLSEELPKLDYKQLVSFVSYDEIKRALDEYLNGSNETTVVDTPVVAAPSSSASPVSSSTDYPSSGTADDDLEQLLNSI